MKDVMMGIHSAARHTVLALGAVLLAVAPGSAVERTQPEQPARAAQAAQPAQATQPVQSAHPAQATEPALRVQPAITTQPARATQPVKAIQPAQPAQPAQLAQPEQSERTATVVLAVYPELTSIAVAEARPELALLAAQPQPAMNPEPAVQPAPPAPPPPPPEVPNATGVIKLMGMGGSFLGVGVREIDSERARTLSLKDEYGVEITRVEDESPASKAGLKVGDVVLEFNGQRVEGTEQFVRVVRETPAGRTVKLLVSRNGGSMTLPATIASRKVKGMGQTMPAMPMEGMRIEAPHYEFTMPDIPKAMMSWRSAVLGVEAESLGESQLANYFGVKEGVLVRSVMKGTAAEKAGIRAGDVLMKVDETKVATPRDVTSAVRSARTSAKKSFPVILMREKKEVSVSVTVDEDSGESSETPKKQKITVRQRL